MVNPIRRFIRKSTAAITRRTIPDEEFIAVGRGAPRDRTTLPTRSQVRKPEEYWMMYKNEPPARGSIGMLVAAATSTGYDVRTFAGGDDDKKNPRVKEVHDWLGIPALNFHDVRREILNNVLHSGNSFVELTKEEKADKKNNKRGRYGWMFPLEFRFCRPEGASDGKAYTKLHYDASGYDVEKALVNSETDPYDKQFIHIKLDSSGSLKGLSLLESLAMILSLYNETVEYQMEITNQNGEPSTVYIYEGTNPEDYKRLVKSVTDIDKGEDLIIMGEVKVVPLGGTATGDDFEKIAERVYQDTMTTTHVPPVFMCLQQGGSQESSREGVNAFELFVQSLQLILDNGINQAIHIIKGKEYRDIRVVSRPYVNAKSQAVIDEMETKMGAITPDEIRVRKGKNKVPWGKVPFFQNFLGELIGKKDWNTVPAAGGKPGDPSGRPANKPRPGNEGAEKPVKLLTETIEKLLEQNNQLIDIIKKQYQADEYFSKFYKEVLEDEE
jgi:hypothetical protein